jgi:hypothetical protein
VEDWVLIALVGFAVGLVVGRWWWTLFVAPIPSRATRLPSGD